jgi:putative acetyltransferase
VAIVDPVASSSNVVRLVEVGTAEQVNAAREIFREYGESLGFSLCFDTFEQEMAGLPGAYARPSGRLILVAVTDLPAGCIALHDLGDGVCEMKRLFVRKQFRGLGLGRRLIERLIAEARDIGYRKMRLDTIEEKMTAAVTLYRMLGFREIPPYNEKPVPGALSLELDLTHEDSLCDDQ